jgi:RNA-binding protein
MSMTSKQLAHLRSLAHPLEPFLRIGKEGLTEAIARVVREALGSRELLKVKVLKTAPQTAREIGSALAERLADAHLILVVGRTFVLYRRHPDNPLPLPE